MIIYKTINLINGKCYIGKDSKNNIDYLGSGIILNNAIKKYGKENFKKVILCKCSLKKELNDAEKLYIELFDTIHPKGYNLTHGGDGGDTFSFIPDDLKQIRREKLSNANKGNIGWNKGLTKETDSRVRDFSNKKRGKKQSEETKRKQSESHKGITTWNKGKKTGQRSKETREKISKSNKGKIITQGMREKISKTLTGRKNPEQSKRLKGRIPWNKGKKLTQEQKKNYKTFKKGNIPWNAGKSKYNLIKEK